MLIYRITNKISGKAYVGQTCNLKKRLGEHRQLRSGANQSSIQAAIHKYGWEAFAVDILDKANCTDELNRLEVEWIDKLGTAKRGVGYNLALGGGGARGVVRSAETCARLSLAARQRVNNEYREHMAAVHRGKPKTLEHREKLRVNACKRPSARIVEFNGESLNVSEWARRVGVSKEVLKYRLDKGMPIKQALAKPLGRWA